MRTEAINTNFNSTYKKTSQNDSRRHLKTIQNRTWNAISTTSGTIYSKILKKHRFRVPKRLQKGHLKSHISAKHAKKVRLRGCAGTRSYFSHFLDVLRTPPNPRILKKHCKVLQKRGSPQMAKNSLRAHIFINLGSTFEHLGATNVIFSKKCNLKS